MSKDIVGIIGGSGLYKMEGVEIREERQVKTPFGEPSDAVMLGTLIAVIAVIGVMRGTQALLELAVGWDRAVYLSYFIFGALFSVVGLLLFHKRNAATG